MLLVWLLGCWQAPRGGGGRAAPATGNASPLGTGVFGPRDAQFGIVGKPGASSPLQG